MESTNIPTTAQTYDINKDTDNDLPNDNLHPGTTVKTPAKSTDEILQELTKNIEKIDFEVIAFPDISSIRTQITELKRFVFNEDGTLIEENKAEREEYNKLQKKLTSYKLSKNHCLIICIEELNRIAQDNEWGLSKKNGSIYLYNSSFWSEIDKERFQFFLGNIALKMGVEKYKGKIYTFKEDLFKQFMADTFLPYIGSESNNVLINLRNGTFEISATNRGLRNFDPQDFITHQLPFNYDPKATSPMFQKYLDEVLPNKDKQKVLAEYCGYIFTKSSVLKLEKILILFGTGANGKSVFFEIINALLGKENTSNYSLQSLTNDTGYQRAKIANKLLNYASEINGKLETDVFKQMASGEPIEARLPYGDPFILHDYAKMIFNCNELPKEVERTNAFFRRFLIINFDVTILESNQDKELSNKIIKNELSGVFNWILEGLERLMIQKNFSKCEAVENARSEYEKQSDSVQLFINENGFRTSTTQYILIPELYKMYKTFCIDEGYKTLGKSKFRQQLEYLKIYVTRMSMGNMVYLESDTPKT